MSDKALGRVKNGQNSKQLKRRMAVFDSNYLNCTFIGSDLVSAGLGFTSALTQGAFSYVVYRLLSTLQYHWQPHRDQKHSNQSYRSKHFSKMFWLRAVCITNDSFHFPSQPSSQTTAALYTSQSQSQLQLTAARHWVFRFRCVNAVLRLCSSIRLLLRTMGSNSILVTWPRSWHSTPASIQPFFFLLHGRNVAVSYTTAWLCHHLTPTHSLTQDFNRITCTHFPNNSKTKTCWLEKWNGDPCLSSILFPVFVRTNENTPSNVSHYNYSTVEFQIMGLKFRVH